MFSGLIEGQLHDVLEKALRPRAIALIILSFGTKLYLTTVAGVDWMLHETAAQRQFENMTKAEDELKDVLDGEVNIWRLTEMARKRARHLDAFVELKRQRPSERR